MKKQDFKKGARMRKLTAFLTMVALATTAWGQGSEYFPMKTGRKLHYQATISQSFNAGGQVMGSTGASHAIEEAAGPSKALGKDAFLVRSVRKDSVSGQMGTMTVSYTNEAHYRVTPVGVYILGTIRVPSDLEERPESTLYEPPLLVLRLPADSGTGWRVGTLKLRGASITTDAKIAGKEDVTVPGGTFKNCLKVKQTSVDMGGKMSGGGAGMEFAVTGGELSTTVWYAPGVGVVKEQVYTRLALSAPNMPPGASLDAVFEQTRQLIKMEGAAAGKQTKKDSGKK
jgi:hypothetical protein